MIIEIDANLLEFPLDGFCHQANCFHTFGAGIALSIKNKYPELYQADIQHGKRGDITRLGKFSTVKCHDDKQGYNLYGQYGFGMGERHTNYEAVYTGLYNICVHASLNNVIKLGCPNRMGCVLGGGSWNIVREIIEDIFARWTEGDLYICNYDG